MCLSQHHTSEGHNDTLEIRDEYSWDCAACLGILKKNKKVLAVTMLQQQSIRDHIMLKCAIVHF